MEYDDIRTCQPDLGNEVNVCGLDEKPKRVSWNCKADKLYTLALIDLYPLGPDHPLELSVCILWLVVDIPRCNVNGGITIIDYQPPLPLFGSKLNTYAIVALEQDPDIDWSEQAIVSST